MLDTELEKLREITRVLTANGYLMDQAAEWEYALDAIPESIYIINRNYQIKFINKSLAKKLNLSNKKEVYDKYCYDVIRSDTDEKNKDLDCICDLEKDDFGYGEHYIDVLEGWYRYNRSPIYTSTGKLLGYICVLRNITDVRVAESDLKHSLNLFNGTFKAAPVGLGVISCPEHKFIMVNNEFCNITKYTEEELIGKSSEIIYPTKEEFEEISKVKCKVVKEEGFSSLEFKIKTKEGNIRVVSMNIAKVCGEDNDKEAIIAIEDITERKINEDKFRTIFELSPDVISIIKFGEGTIEEVNKTFTDLSGYDKEEVIGKNIVDLNLWTDLEDRNKFYEHLISYGKVDGMRAKFRLKSGEIKDVVMNSKIISMGEEKYVITITMDAVKLCSDSV